MVFIVVRIVLVGEEKSPDWSQKKLIVPVMEDKCSDRSQKRIIMPD
jgi:hypothetical protein